jgi:hypothetical protein
MNSQRAPRLLFLRQYFKPATRRALAVTSLLNLLSDYLGHQCFCESANFRVFGNDGRERTTIAGNDAVSTILLNARGSAYSLQRCYGHPEAAFEVTALWPTRLSTS